MFDFGWFPANLRWATESRLAWLWLALAAVVLAAFIRVITADPERLREIVGPLAPAAAPGPPAR